MNRRELLLSAAGGAAMLAWPFPVGWTAQGKGRRKHVLFFTKSSQFEHSVVHRSDGKLSLAETKLTELGKKHGFDVTATKDGGVFDSDLQRYDAIYFFTQGDMTPGLDKQPEISASGKRALLDVIHQGTGFVGNHCATDTYKSAGPANLNQAIDDRDPYIRMIGGQFIVHGAQQEAGLDRVDAHFPGTKDVAEGFRITDEWYALKNFAPDLHVLLLQDTKGMEGEMYHRPPYPQTWARQHGKGRVFYTSMGHREDVWENPVFHQVLLGGIAWAVGNLKADVRPNLKAVAPHADQLAV